jgi:superfamily I DNA/RNA helicase
LDGADTLIEVLQKVDLADALPEEYRTRHLEIASLVRMLLDQEQLVGDQESWLCAAVGYSIEVVREKLGIPDDEEAIGEPAVGEGVAEDNPTIICTSLVGAKGMSGGYVYIVGCNDSHFPRNPNQITDAEVCCFLVALSRTRKECHLISCNMFGSLSLNTSRFLTWIQEHVDHVKVNAAWFNAN